MKSNWSGIPKFKQTCRIAANKTLRTMMVDVIKDADLQVPLDTGRLMSTRYVRRIRNENGIVIYKAAYGGNALPSMIQSSPELISFPRRMTPYKEDKPISYAKRTYGQLNYAIRWHENTPKNGFGNGRKQDYLIDPFRKHMDSKIAVLLAINIAQGGFDVGFDMELDV